MPLDRMWAKGVGIALIAIITLTAIVLLQSRQRPPPVSEQEPTSASGALVVGAGVAGLSAAYELAKGGARVVVIDLGSVFGGHAVMATGDLCMVGTPFQEAQGIHDTPDIAYEDLMKWGEDPNPEWARYYVEHSREEIYDWLTGMGVTFESLGSPPGNSVRRTHRTKGRGIGLVSPIFAECARRPNIQFDWNIRADRLITEGKRVVGVGATQIRTDRKVEYRAAVVVLATGGFQSNLDMVRESWSNDAPFPEHFLVGSGMNSLGSGHKIAQGVGAELTRLDHQWNYITGLPDPRFPGTQRGLNAMNPDSVWVNADGKRFIAERTSAKYGFPALVKQKGSTYWSIFDADTKHSFWVAGSDWGSFAAIDRLIFANHELVKSADTIEALAAKVGLPTAAVKETIDHYNEMVDTGVDVDFGRFGPGKAFQPKKIGRPPFYAVQFFPLSRKSMGGVAIDRSGRVLDTAHRPIAGLYAAGELTGLAGINGKAGLEGTFIGPSIVTGRVAGRAALGELGANARPERLPVPSASASAGRSEPSGDGGSTRLCLSCHDLSNLVAQSRQGYWHFQKVHSVVLADRYECTKCHAEISPVYQPPSHRIDRVAQITVCGYCHLGEDR
jgi:flavocytochrome c